MLSSSIFFCFNAVTWIANAVPLNANFFALIFKADVFIAIVVL